MPPQLAPVHDWLVALQQAQAKLPSVILALQLQLVHMSIVPCGILTSGPAWQACLSVCRHYHM